MSLGSKIRTSHTKPIYTIWIKLILDVFTVLRTTIIIKLLCLIVLKYYFSLKSTLNMRRLIRWLILISFVNCVYNKLVQYLHELILYYNNHDYFFYISILSTEVYFEELVKCETNKVTLSKTKLKDIGENSEPNIYYVKLNVK